MSTSGPPSTPPPSPTGPPTVSPMAKHTQLVRSGANWFIWIAGLSLVNSVLFVTGSHWSFFLGLAATQVSDEFGKVIITGTTGVAVALAIDVVIAAIFVGLGLMSRSGALWSFIVGMVLIVLDALLLVWVQDWAAVAFHALALFFVFRGFQAARQLAEADLEGAVATAVRARNQNNGQSCIAAKRFIVEEPVADQFTQKFAAAVKALRVGDPMQRDTNVGPLARQDLRDALADQVERSVSSGAHTVVGGNSLSGKGYFYAPTVLDGVSADMPAFREETFGPVAAVIRARDPLDAVRLANDTEYGLGAALWTRDIERAKQLARRIEAGNVFINGMVASDPRLPFGGIKRSGYGRELGVFGIREFVNIQTIVVGLPSQPARASSE